MTVSTFTIAANGDDICFASAGYSSWGFDLFGGGTTLLAGRTAGATDVGSWLRFTSVTVPQGATINSATLKLNNNGSGNNGGTPVLLKIQCESADNPTMPSGGTDAASRTLGTAATFSSGVTTGIYSFDITAAVQAVINRSGFASGNAMSVVIADNGSNSTFDIRFRAREAGSGVAPQLEIDYTAASPTYTGSAALTASPATTATSGSHTAPTYTASPTLSAATATVALSGTHTAPTYTGSLALAAGPAETAIAGQHVAYAGALSLSTAAAAAETTGTHTAPVYSGTLDLSTEPTEASISGTHVAYVGTLALSTAVSETAIDGLFTPVYSSDATLQSAPATTAISGSHAAPVYGGTVELTAGAVETAVTGTHSEFSEYATEVLLSTTAVEVGATCFYISPPSGEPASLNGRLQAYPAMSGFIESRPAVGGQACVAPALSGFIEASIPVGGSVTMRPAIGGFVRIKP